MLVNNAGITRDTLSMRMKDDDWDAVLDTNLKAVFRLSRAVLRPMMKQRYGRIVNITSVVGAWATPARPTTPRPRRVSAGMTRSLARELGSRGITVNCVAPGFVATDMTAACRRRKRPRCWRRSRSAASARRREIAHAVAFLASPLAGYVTGASCTSTAACRCVKCRPRPARPARLEPAPARRAPGPLESRTVIPKPLLEES